MRRRLGKAAASAENLPELLIGDEKVERLKGHVQRVKDSELTRWVTKTPARALIVYCALPVLVAPLLSWAYRTAPFVAVLLEIALRFMISGACLLTASQLASARRTAAPAQRRSEQQWLVGCLFAFGIRFEPVLFILQRKRSEPAQSPVFPSWVTMLWPVGWIEPFVANASFYLLLGLITLVLTSIVNRASDGKRRGSSW